MCSIAKKLRTFVKIRVHFCSTLQKIYGKYFSRQRWKRRPKVSSIFLARQTSEIIIGSRGPWTNRAVAPSNPFFVRTTITITGTFWETRWKENGGRRCKSKEKSKRSRLIERAWYHYPRIWPLPADFFGDQWLYDARFIVEFNLYRKRP